MILPSPPPYAAIPNPYHSSQGSDGSDSSPSSSQGSKDLISRFGSPASDYSQTSYGSDQDTRKLDLSPSQCGSQGAYQTPHDVPLPGTGIRKSATFPTRSCESSYEVSNGREASLPSLRTRRTFPVPPTLSRSSDVKEQFVNNLVDSAKILVEVIWPLAASPRHSLSLKTYIQEILKRTKTSFSTLQVALYYLILIKDRVPMEDFTMEQTQDIGSVKGLMCGRRMFLTAIILSSKYLQDKNFSSKAWSKITSLSVREINANEVQFLREVDWQLHVPEAKFNKWQNVLIDYSKPMFTEQWRIAVETMTPEFDNLPPLPHMLTSPSLKEMLQSPIVKPSTPPGDVPFGRPISIAEMQATVQKEETRQCPIQQGAVKGLNAMLSAWNLCQRATASRCVLDRCVPNTGNWKSPNATLVATPTSTLSYSSQASTPYTPLKPLMTEAFTESPSSSESEVSDYSAYSSGRKRHRQSFDHQYYNFQYSDKVDASAAATSARGLLRAAQSQTVSGCSPLTRMGGETYSDRFVAGNVTRPFSKRLCMGYEKYRGKLEPLNVG